MNPLTKGQKVPAMTLLDIDGKTVPLESFLGAPLLLIFLRHLA